MLKIYNLIGLAKRGGRASSGAIAVKNSIISKKAKLVILSNDIADNAKEALYDLCQKRQVPCVILEDRNRLGASVGKEYRVAVTIDDEGLAKAILKAVKAEGEKIVEVVEWQK